jgi:hypothetical protein
MCGARANFRATAREHQKSSAACRQIYGRAISEDDSQLEVIISYALGHARTRWKSHSVFLWFVLSSRQGYQERVSVRTVSV